MFVRAHPNFVARVRFDNFVRYNPVHDQVQADLARYDALCAEFTSLRAKLDAAQMQREISEIFKKAVASGIVKLDGVPVVTFEAEDPETYIAYDGELSKASMPFGHIPLYQAFLSFRSLPAEQLRTVGKLAASRMDDAETMRSALETAAAYASEENAAKWKKAADALYKPNKAEIIPFINELTAYVRQMKELY